MSLSSICLLATFKEFCFILPVPSPDLFYQKTVENRLASSIYIQIKLIILQEYLQLVLCCVVGGGGGGLEGPPTSRGLSSSSSRASDRAVSSACLRYTDKLLVLFSHHHKCDTTLTESSYTILVGIRSFGLVRAIILCDSQMWLNICKNMVTLLERKEADDQ